MNDFAHAQEVEGKTMRNFGIWSKNRWEWLATQVSAWYACACVAGFYDSMDDNAVCYIANQTVMSTIYCEDKYVAKLLKLKQDGRLPSLENIVNYDESVALKAECEAAGMKLYSFS